MTIPERTSVCENMRTVTWWRMGGYFQCVTVILCVRAVTIRKMLCRGLSANAWILTQEVSNTVSGRERLRACHCMETQMLPFLFTSHFCNFRPSTLSSDQPSTFNVYRYLKMADVFVMTQPHVYNVNIVFRRFHCMVIILFPNKYDQIVKLISDNVT